MPRYLTIDSPSAGQHHKESCIMAPRMLLRAKEPVLNIALQSVGSQHPSSLCTSSHNLWNPFLPTLIWLFSKAESPLTASSVLVTESHTACLYFKASKWQKKKNTTPKKAIIFITHFGCKKTLNCLKPLTQRYGCYRQLTSTTHTAAMPSAVPGGVSLSQITGY